MGSLPFLKMVLEARRYDCSSVLIDLIVNWHLCDPVVIHLLLTHCSPENVDRFLRRLAEIVLGRSESLGFRLLSCGLSTNYSFQEIVSSKMTLIMVCAGSSPRGSRSDTIS